ncbi:MAG TPA: hypothetical protein VME46_04090 [Acidimicrobiales bacterium]|nr:hypothetical protein [Acidimicrobiales bacterium]
MSPRRPAELRLAIFIDGWNDRCRSLSWTKTTDDILAHARQGTSDARH